MPNIGVPVALAFHIKHLEALLKGLPTSLPLNPVNNLSTYHFGWDAEDIEEEGLFYAFNRCLEVCFETHKLHGQPIVLKERGEQLKNLIQMYKRLAKEAPNDREMLKVWLEQLISAAKLAGVKIPNK
ncbi:hypothetical protein H0H92_009395, partial [Tricholoma furcatifolium]